MHPGRRETGLGSSVEQPTSAGGLAGGSRIAFRGAYPFALGLAWLLGVAACSPTGSDAPYLEFAGGGFVFNYRLSAVDYGFVARVVRKIPSGTLVEAEFEDPSGGRPITVTQTAAWGKLSYVFRTPPVTGVEANRDYRVEVRLRDPDTRVVFARYSRTFRSDVDQAILPAQAPVVGPGYQPAAAPESGNGG